MNMLNPLSRLFPLGQTVITRTAESVLNPEDIFVSLRRHAAGDWGLLGEKAWRENDHALRNGGRLFSVYAASSGQKFCVITRSDRAVTTVLLPEAD